MQKRAPVGSSVLQLEQLSTNTPPQFKQKRAVGGFFIWQWGQFIDEFPPNNHSTIFVGLLITDVVSAEILIRS